MSDTPAITPADIEAKFGQLKDEIDGATGSAQQSILRTGIVVALVILILAFLIGRRQGRASRTVVEIRRV